MPNDSFICEFYSSGNDSNNIKHNKESHKETLRINSAVSNDDQSEVP